MKNILLISVMMTSITALLLSSCVGGFDSTAGNGGGGTCEPPNTTFDITVTTGVTQCASTLTFDPDSLIPSASLKPLISATGGSILNLPNDANNKKAFFVSFRGIVRKSGRRVYLTNPNPDPASFSIDTHHANWGDKGYDLMTQYLNQDENLVLGCIAYVNLACYIYFGGTDGSAGEIAIKSTKIGIIGFDAASDDVLTVITYDDGTGNSVNVVLTDGINALESAALVASPNVSVATDTISLEGKVTAQ